MDRRSNVVLVAAVVGALFVNHGLPTARYDRASASAETKGQDLSQAVQDGLGTLGVCEVSQDLACAKGRCLCPSDDFTDTISRFFLDERGEGGGMSLADPPRTRESTQTRANREVSSNSWSDYLAPLEVAGKLKLVIALVPDPVHTHLGLFFDRSIEAVQQAAQSEGYTFSRATMPWDAGEETEPTNFRLRLEEQTYQQAREDIPGVMIFRKSRGHGDIEYLLVFVVGELPTEGISKPQFRNALRAILAIRTASRVPAQQPLLMLGPTFSGSLYSLGEILKKSREIRGFDRIYAYSGTIASGETAQWLQDQLPARFSFRNFNCCDGDALTALGQYAPRLGYSAKQIAILSEDETAYGYELDLAKIYFPRDVASLRTAYDRDLRQAQLAGDQGTRPPHSKLQLNLEDTGRGDDTVATYSPFQTPISQQNVIQQIVMRLRAARSRLVVLRATNPLDLLFLSHYLHDSYPQARIVTLTADLLFQNESGYTPLSGMLVVTRYPLWVGSGNSASLAFPSSESESTYLAMRSLLQPNLPGQPQDPQLWLGILGHDGYRPLAILSQRFTHPKNPDVLPLVRSPIWILLCCLAVLLGVSCVRLLEGGSIFSKSSLLAIFAPIKNSIRSAILAMLALLILCFFLEVLLPYSFALRNLQRGWRWLLGSLVWAAVGIFVLSCFGQIKQREPIATSEAAGVSEGSVWRVRPSYLFLVFSACVATFFLLWLWLSSGPDRIFLYRYIHIFCGVSPSVPLMLVIAAGLWWSWQSLAGLTLLDKRRPRLPTNKDLSLPPDDVRTQRLQALSEESNHRLSRLAMPMVWDPWVHGPPLVAAAVAAAMLIDEVGIRAPLTFEGLRFDLVYGALLVFVCFLLVSSLSRLTVTWLECRHLLRALDRLPLRQGFKRLKGFSWKPIWQLSLSSFDTSTVILSRSVESLSHLANTLRSCKLNPELRTSVYAAMEELKSIRAGLEVHKNREDQLVESFCVFRRRIAAVCAVGLKFLSEAWEAEDGPIRFETPEGEGALDRISPEIEAVEQFVCLVFFNFILAILLRIRNLAVIVAGTFILVALSLTSYPFVIQTLLRSFMFFVFLALTGIMTVVFAQMHRDATLSAITDTKPGELGADFWLKIGGAVGVPLLGFMTYQFPQVGGFLLSWLQPAFQALR